MAVLVCGIVPAGSEPDTANAVGQLRLVRSGALAVAVRDVADDAVLGDKDAEHYFETLVALLAHGPVLPVRFGTVAPDDDAVKTEILDAGRDELVERLELLTGLVEVRIRIEIDANEATRTLAAASPGRLARWRARAGS